MASAKQKAAFAAMLAGKKGETTKSLSPTKGKNSNSIGSSGEMVGGPIIKGKAPISPKGKKSALKIDIMLAKAMPGIGPKGKPTKKSGTKKGKC